MARSRARSNENGSPTESGANGRSGSMDSRALPDSVEPGPAGGGEMHEKRRRQSPPVERRILRPLSALSRVRLSFVALVSLLAGLVISDYSLQPLTYTTYSLVDAPRAAQVADLGNLPPSVADNDAEVRQLRRQLNILQSRVLVKALSATHYRFLRLRRIEFLWRHPGNLPRLAVQRVGRSNIVRLRVVAAHPVEAQRIADAAADILVREERSQYLRLLRTEAATGAPVDPSQATIDVVHNADLPHRRIAGLHRAARYIGPALLLISLGLMIRLLLDPRRRPDALLSPDAGAFIEGDEELLSIPIAATLRMTGRRPHLTVAQSVWSWIATIPAMSAKPEGTPVVVLFAPCGPPLLAGVPAADHCRAGALYFARLAAGRGQKVLLVESNVAIGAEGIERVHTGPLPLPHLPGFPEVLMSGQPPDQWLLVDQEESHNLSALSGGCVPVSSGDHMGSASMRLFVSHCAGLADILVMSAPELTSDSERRAQELKPYWAGAADWADVAIIVNDSGVSSAPLAVRCAAGLLAAGLPTLGQVTLSDPQSEA